MEEEQTKITHTPSIKLTKLQKGYSWEIRISNEDLKKALEEVEQINNQMLNKFKSGKKE